MSILLTQALSRFVGGADPRKNNIFKDIIGHENIKQIFLMAMRSKRPVHLLLLGSPGLAKTLFLTQIMSGQKASYFVIGSNTTKAGLINQLFERKPKFLLIDEIEKMSVTDQISLLHLMETGIISETKINKTREMKLDTWVFSTANSYEKLIAPLLSRFALLVMTEYTSEEFEKISIMRLARENVDESIARTISQRVWYELDSRDIRDVIKVARLVRSINEIPFVIKMLNNKRRLSERNYI